MKKLSMLLSLLFWSNILTAQENSDNNSSMQVLNLQKGEEVYSQDFNQLDKLSGQWIIRQDTVWTIENGILKGLPSPKEHQQKLIASGQKSKLGIKAKAVLNHKIKKYVTSFKFMFDDKPGEKHFTFGHNISNVFFNEKGTRLMSKSKTEAPRDQRQDLIIEPFKWYDLLAEVSEEHLTIQIRKPDGEIVKLNGHFPEYKKSKNLNLEFTGTTGGQVSVDDLKIWKAK